MITKCWFCNYTKESPLSLDILRIFNDPNLPEEDSALWQERIVEVHGTHDWNSVKIHMGIKHKAQTYKDIWPNCSFSEEELRTLKEQVS